MASVLATNGWSRNSVKSTVPALLGSTGPLAEACLNYIFLMPGAYHLPSVIEPSEFESVNLSDNCVRIRSTRVWPSVILLSATGGERCKHEPSSSLGEHLWRRICTLRPPLERSSMSTGSRVRSQHSTPRPPTIVSRWFGYPPPRAACFRRRVCKNERPRNSTCKDAAVSEVSE